MKLKILFFTHRFYPDIGGLESNAEILATSFSKLGHEVCVVTWTEAIGPAIFSFKLIRNPGFFQLLHAHKWADIVFENNPCLRLSWPNIFLKRPGVIALNTWVNRVNGKLGYQDRLKIYLLKRASKVIAVSDAIRIKIWPSAVVVSNPYKDDLFKITGEVNRNIDFVFLGRLVSDKGANLAIEAMKYFLNSSLTIIGNGMELPALKNLAMRFNLEERVHFVGSLSGKELVSCLNKHKYLLVPSVWDEPFGNVVLEGLACGCLPIASNSGGLPDAVGNAGVLFNRGDVNSLVCEINNLLNNPAQEAQLRKNAAGQLLAHRPHIVAQQYLSILTKAVSK